MIKKFAPTGIRTHDLRRDPDQPFCHPGCERKARSSCAQPFDADSEFFGSSPKSFVAAKHRTQQRLGLNVKKLFFPQSNDSKMMFLVLYQVYY